MSGASEPSGSSGSSGSSGASLQQADLAGLGKRSILGFVGAGVSGVSTILTILIASRGLNENGTGAFFVAIAAFSIAQGLASLGLDAGLQYFIPAISAAGARRWIRRALGISLVAGATVAAIVWWQSDGLAALLVRGGEQRTEDVAVVLRSAAVLLPIAASYEVVMSGLRATDRIVWAVFLDRVARPFAQVAAMAGVASVDGPPDAMFSAWALPFAIAAAAAIATLWFAPHRRGDDDQVGDVDGATFWRYTGPRAAARFAQVVTQRADVLLLSALASVKDAGVYGTVSRCMIAGVFVATAVQQVVQPRLRRQVLSGRTEAVRATYMASTTWLVLATWPVYLMMAAFAPVLLGFFGGDTPRGATALTVLSLTMLVASGCGLVDVVLLMLGRSLLSTAFVIAALVSNLTLNVVLIPRFGMTGAAAAWAVSILITNLGPLASVARRGVNPWGKPLFTAGLVATFGVMVPALVVRAIAGPTRTGLAIAIGFGTATFAGFVSAKRRTLLLNDLVADVSGRNSRRST